MDDTLRLSGQRQEGRSYKKPSGGEKKAPGTLKSNQQLTLGPWSQLLHFAE